jgi:4-amino-4-deoxy-L-arabinose transferase-like glycosyltransferase
VTGHGDVAGGTAEARTARRSVTGFKWYALAWLGTALLAAYIYQPWRDLGFDLEDFSEFQPILEHAASLSSRFSALTEYYATQGRWNVVGYAFLAAKWTLFGPEPVTWQWLRLVQMLGVACLASQLIVRLGVSRPVAWASASLFLFSSAAAASFVRLTLGEPLALVFLLGALLLAARYQKTRRWKLCGIGISLCLGLLLATKEVLIVCVPFVLAFGMSWRDGAFHRLRWSKRNAFLAAAVAATVILISIPIISVVMRTEPGSYDSAYRVDNISAAKFLVLAFYMVMPVQHSSPPEVFPLLYPANIIVGILGGSGLLIWLRFGARLPRPLPLVSGALCLALAGAVVYAPWPRFEDFYALPFLLGVALVLAFAVEAAGERARANYCIALGTLLLGVLYMVVAAQAAVEYGFARRAATNELVETLQSFHGLDSVLVGTTDPGLAWHQRAGTLERSMRNRSRDAAVPSIVGVPCADAAENRVLPTSVAVVNYVRECGEIGAPGMSVEYHFKYRDWRTLGTRRDSFVIELKRGSRP